jgi:hypothetical protein
MVLFYLRNYLSCQGEKQKASVILETYEINNSADVKLYSLLEFVLFYHYKDLTERISEVERIEPIVNNSKRRRGLTKKEEEKEKDFPPLQSPAPPQQLKLSEF